MPEWLSHSFHDSFDVDWKGVLTRLVISLALGAVVGGIYCLTRRRKDITGSFPATLVLLSVLIALVTQVVGNNVARAFSLVGALSIVRFRTVVRDTKDTAFVIFSVGVGMAVGAGLETIALCGMLVAGSAAALYRDRSTDTLRCPAFLVVVRMAWSADRELFVAEAVARNASNMKLVSMNTVRHGTALEVTYHTTLISTCLPTQLLKELHQIEGVQDVELQCADESD